jgi:hypothetical protein
MFYAAQSPRGFRNEINVHSFETKAARDQWVAKHSDDGDVNSASCGAYKVTSRRAREILGFRGDAEIENFNGYVCHSR